MTSKKLIGAIASGAVIVAIAIGTIMSVHKIKPGYVGIVYNMNGGVQGKTLSQGFKFTAPWQSVTQYSVATEQGYLSKDKREGSEGDDSFGVPSSDGKMLNVDLEYSYHFDAEKLPEVFTKFKGKSGKDIEDTFMRGKFKTWVGEASSKYAVIDIYGEKRAELNASALKIVKEKFEQYGIVIDTVNFSRIGLDEATEKAIQERINAQQKLEQAKIEKQQAEIAADKARVEAKGIADSQVIKATGEAEANDKLAKSLTPALIQKMEMEARQKHGWVTIQGGQPIVNATK